MTTAEDAEDAEVWLFFPFLRVPCVLRGFKFIREEVMMNQ